MVAGATYHYRVVVESAGGVVYGRDQTFTTQTVGGSLTLPDSRQWELVSPVNKHGGAILPIESEGGLIQSAADGGAMTYIADSPTELNPADNTATQYTQVFSDRAAGGGWSAQDIGPVHDTATGVQVGSPTEFW